ncbi:MAG: DUF3365 domain-containing protein [Prolixibacteraceae bacterium]|nr:DUF3365 domain-containing protein [Prolixibacteraceae bacterium]
MRKSCILYLFFLVAILVSCNGKASKIDPETYSEYQKRGDEVTNLAQATLLANVGSAIQKGGTEYAVEFCNLQASTIVDSLNSVNNCTISRLSEKNRNPENNLENSSDFTIAKMMSTGAVKDTLIFAKNMLIYYKPIRTGLDACLKCHGDPQTDINEHTLTKIKNLYPNDLATGYQLNDFRGIWKVEFALR